MPRSRVRGPATIEDVAAVAGVSVATVSRALRGLPNVAEGTRHRVLDVADRLGYHADPHASRLAAGRTLTVGMAVPLLERWFFGQVVAGAEAELAAVGYDILLYGVDGEEALARFLSRSAVYRKRTDGLILVDVRMADHEFTRLAAEGVRMATIGPVSDHFSSVSIDNVAAAELAVDHLHDLGHRRIGFIGGQPDSPIHFEVPDLRRQGFVAAAERLGLPLDPALRVLGGFTAEGGRAAMAELLARPDPPTAVFACSDEMALGAVRAARDLGLDVPGDVSVIGFDDHDLAEILGLSTVRQPVRRHGHAVAKLLLDELAGRAEGPRHVVHDAALVARATTAPVPVRR